MLSAAITHAHPEGQAGAVAVALAAAVAATRPDADRRSLLEIADWLAPVQVRDRLVRAAGLPAASPGEAGAAAMSCAGTTIPVEWLAQREPLPKEMRRTS